MKRILVTSILLCMASVAVAQPIKTLGNGTQFGPRLVPVVPIINDVVPIINYSLVTAKPDLRR